jgi:hypothetical protein
MFELTSFTPLDFIPKVNRCDKRIIVKPLCVSIMKYNEAYTLRPQPTSNHSRASLTNTHYHSLTQRTDIHHTAPYQRYQHQPSLPIKCCTCVFFSWFSVYTHKFKCNCVYLHGAYSSVRRGFYEQAFARSHFQNK